MVKLEIILNDDGAVSVNGPITNKILCYGMLEVARQAVEDFKTDGSKIVAPPPGLKVT